MSKTYKLVGAAALASLALGVGSAAAAQSNTSTQTNDSIVTQTSVLGSNESYTIQRSRNSTRQRDFIFEDQTNSSAQSNVADTFQDSAVLGDNYQETHQSARNRTRQRG